MIPVDLHVGADTEHGLLRRREARQLACHHPRQPRREAEVADRFPRLAVCREAFQHRRLQRDAGAGGGVHRLGVRVLGPPREHQTPAPARRRRDRTEVERQRVVGRVAEPRARGKRVHGPQVTPTEERQYVAAALVRRRLQCVPLLEREEILARERRREDEPLVRVHDYALRVLDHVEPEAVEVEHLVHRLGDFEDVLPVPRAELVGLDLHRLLGPRRADRPVRPALAERPAAEEVGDEHVPLPVPRHQHRARRALAVRLLQPVRGGGDADFGLNHGVRPAHAERIGALVPAETEHGRQ